MPQEPKRRHSKARKNTRRASISLDQPALHLCTNCGSQIMSHIACRSCGFYAGKSATKAKTQVQVVKA